MPTDRELTCRDCSSSFVFTAGEQEFYATKGLQNDPVRCPSCRAQRKMMRPEDRDETPSYGVYASWGGRTPRQLHVATCSGCYNEERKRQEAAETAETEAMAARAASAPTSSNEPELEGSGRDDEEEEEAREIVKDDEALADSTPAPPTT